ncbi:hypothetical protein HYC85_024608 [Camellia sinensis]|uniref:Uncharacterized protein n=1 Tax=Camellia sinensis TaxID=4442 RepID=A0A7J7G8K8_CAMSI|nr:hypothetical protein HYC85_024608 [Camellia sinensis]
MTRTPFIIVSMMLTLRAVLDFLTCYNEQTDNVPESNGVCDITHKRPITQL